jgi:integral membrane protein
VAQPEGAALTGALRRYQVMAYVVGVGLLLLVAVGMPLQYVAGQPIVVQVIGPLHGMAYIVYLVAALDLARRARLSVWQIAAMIGAGLVPLVAFYVERRITRRLAVLAT